MDRLFDETMDNLVMCGTVCLRRLSAIVMTDIKVFSRFFFAIILVRVGSNG